MKRSITLVIWVACMLALLAGCSGQGNEIGNINDYGRCAGGRKRR